jgi:putative colanic acid biosynthesis UDP-glucose lipid carrier transferase
MLPKGLLKEYSRLLALLMRFFDLLMVFLAAFGAYWLKFGCFTLKPTYLSAVLLGTFIAGVVFSFLGLYQSVRGKGVFAYIGHLIQAFLLLTLSLACLAFFTKSGEAFSRIWFSLWMGLSLALVVCFRLSLIVLLRFMRRRGWNERRVVIVGAGELGVNFAQTVQQALWTGFRIVNFFDDEVANKPRAIGVIPVLKTPDNLAEYLTQQGIDEVWLALPLRAQARVKAILQELKNSTVTTRFVLDIFGLDLLNHSITDVAGFPVLNIHSSPMVGMNRVVKAIEDRIIAAGILLLIAPLFLLIALLVKVSSRGPVFFKQQRLGWDGRIIKVYKFRTMVLHNEAQGQVTQAKLGDPRITRLGKFLRHTSLDELPQFINVLQGRMSIVGPRPHALPHHEYYKKSIHTYMQRHRVKPGITGWAQINGWRGETDTLEKMQKRVEYDLYYINNWSLWFDLKIIFLSFFRGFVDRNAY